jgi:hypothetical protein
MFVTAIALPFLIHEHVPGGIGQGQSYSKCWGSAVVMLLKWLQQDDTIICQSSEINACGASTSKKY